MEDFDLNKYKYEDNIFKVLICNINRIFVYWHITTDYNDNFKEKFGEDFFEKTKPILVLKNLTNNEQEIIGLEEGTNNYYAKIKYSNAIYQAELYRLGKENNDDFGYRFVSNKIKTPNVKILSDNFDNKNVKFKNIKNQKYFVTDDFEKEEIKKLYLEEMLPGWNEYKQENGYLE